MMVQVKIWLVNGESGLNTKKPDPKTLFAAGSRKRIIIPFASLLTPCPGGCAAENPVDTTLRQEPMTYAPDSGAKTAFLSKILSPMK